LPYPLYLGSGRSDGEPLVISSYGDYGDRPLVKTGIKSGVILKKGMSFIAVVGIEFYANKRDPKSIDFVGWDNVSSASGFGSVVGWGQPSESILLEDNIFRFYGGNIVFSGSAKQKNIIVRRNQILNSYSASSHSQGIFAKETSMLLEENLIDHNGWYQQNYETLNSRKKGQATWFNHNVYLSSPTDTVVTGNIITRSSSIGIKVAASADTDTKKNLIAADNLTIRNNLFAEGEIGISAGGNKDFQNGYRFKNLNFKDNVMIHIGDSQPLRRRFAMGMQTVDWDGGSITNNHLMYTDNSDLNNIHGIDITGLTRNVTVSGNVLKNLRVKAGNSVINYGGEKVENLKMFDNKVFDETLEGRLDLVTYFSLNKGTNGVAKLVEKARSQSKESWNDVYTAGKINKYLMD